MSNTDHNTTTTDHLVFDADITYLRELANAILEWIPPDQLKPPGPAIEPPNGLPHGKWPRDVAGPMILRWQRETRQDCGLGQ